MTLIIVILIIFLLAATGISILSLFKNSTLTMLEKIGMSYGMGVIYITTLMYALSMLSLKWNFMLVLLLPVPVICLALLKNWPLIKNIKKISLPNVKLSAVECFVLICITATVIYTILQALLRPIIGWDVIASWYIGGKAFYLDGYINPEYIKYVNYDYPPLVGLFLSFIFTLLGKVEDNITLLTFTAFYISLLISFYAYIRYYLSRSQSLLFTFLLASTQVILRQAGRFEGGHADLLLAYYFFIAFMLLPKYIKKPTLSTGILINIFLAAGSLIKNEGITFLLIIQFIFLVLVLKAKKYSHLFLILIGFLPLLSWQFYKQINYLPGSYLRGSSIHLERIPTIIYEVGLEFLNLSRWNFLWLAFILTLIFYFRSKKYRLFIFIVLGQLFMYLFIYIITPLDYVGQLRSSLDRLLLQLAPIATALVAQLFTKRKNI